MSIINLEKEKEALKDEIKKLESQINPLQKQLNIAREKLSHVDALLPRKGGSSLTLFAHENVNWSEICRQRGWKYVGYSAHRVVRSKDRTLHDSIPHKCVYNSRD